MNGFRGLRVLSQRRWWCQRLLGPSKCDHTREASRCFAVKAGLLFLLVPRHRRRRGQTKEKTKKIEHSKDLEGGRPSIFLHPPHSCRLPPPYPPLPDPAPSFVSRTKDSTALVSGSPPNIKATVEALRCFRPQDLPISFRLASPRCLRQIPLYTTKHSIRISDYNLRSNHPTSDPAAGALLLRTLHHYPDDTVCSNDFSRWSPPGTTVAVLRTPGTPQLLESDDWVFPNRFPLIIRRPSVGQLQGIFEKNNSS